MNSVKLSSMRTDRKRISEGVWQPVAGLNGVRLKVRGINYGPYKTARDELMARLSRLPAEMAKEEKDAARETGFGTLYAEHLLLDWEGFDQPYAPETALAELTCPEAEMLRNMVEQAAVATATPEIEWVKRAAKNSKAPSAGA